MFGKKKCVGCRRGVKKDFAFCPHCGFAFINSPTADARAREKSYLDSDGDMPFGFNFAFNTLFRQLEKQIEKQMREVDKELARNGMVEGKALRGGKITSGISIRIDSTRGTPEIMIKPLKEGIQETLGEKRKSKARTAKGDILPQKLSERHIQLLQNHVHIPREEPKTSIRRLAHGLIYEVALPGVESLDDIFIRKFQNSIEVKAFTKARDKVYFKAIPLNLEVSAYGLQNEKLVLELRE